MEGRCKHPAVTIDVALVTEQRSWKPREHDWVFGRGWWMKTYIYHGHNIAKYVIIRYKQTFGVTFLPGLHLYSLATSGKCKSVWKPHAHLLDTQLAPTSASTKYFQMLPGPPGALQSTFRLCKSILRSSWKHLKLWRYIQDATRLDYSDSQILEHLRLVHRSAGDFESSWDLWHRSGGDFESIWEHCARSAGDLVTYSHK